MDAERIVYLARLSAKGVHRSIRDDMEQEAAIGILEGRHGRWAIVDALRSRYAIPGRYDRNRNVGGAAPRRLVSLDRPVRDLDGLRPVDLLEAPVGDPDAASDALAVLSHPCLSPRESRMLRTYYLEGWTMKAIGRAEHICQSRVMVVLKQAIERLRRCLK